MTVQSSPSTFADRHIGARRQADIDTMLKAVGYDSVDGLVDNAVPDSIRQEKPLTLDSALSEVQVLAELRKLASKNKTAVQMIGQGYYDTVTPPVIRRNILEAPAWYTAYTPYQPEISQGRLEALLNFQTMVQDLTALPVANASLLDEATAVAEAVLLMRRANKNKSAAGGKTVLDADCLPQTIAIVRGRAEALGFEVQVADLSAGLPDGDINGLVLQQPGVSGRVWDQSGVIAEAKERGALVTVAADLLALTLITPPGEQGADIAVGSTQRLGVPLFFGGPHAAYMAVREGMERTLPGRIVGVSKDNAGVPAYRLALQTREQHIRREKATSNICTAQALLAIVSSFYAVYHGPDGLKAIAETVHNNTRALAATLKIAGRELVSDSFFDTLTVRVPGKAAKVIAAAEARGINLRLIDADTVGVSVDETTTPEVLSAVVVAFGAGPVGGGQGLRTARDGAAHLRLPAAPGVQHAPLRNPAAALHPQALGPGPRAGPHHDPAGLLHHEAERHGRDGSHLLAGVRLHPPVRPGLPDRGLARTHRAVSKPTSPRSPGTTRSPSSPTPAPRVSSPACWRSAATTCPAATTSATSA